MTVRDIDLLEANHCDMGPFIAAQASVACTTAKAQALIADMSWRSAATALHGRQHI